MNRINYFNFYFITQRKPEFLFFFLNIKRKTYYYFFCLLINIFLIICNTIFYPNHLDGTFVNTHQIYTQTNTHTHKNNEIIF